MFLFFFWTTDFFTAWLTPHSFSGTSESVLQWQERAHSGLSLTCRHWEKQFLTIFLQKFLCGSEMHRGLIGTDERSWNKLERQSHDSHILIWLSEFKPTRIKVQPTFIWHFLAPKPPRLSSTN